MSTPLPLWAHQLAVFDTETTGVDTAHARIVSSTIAVLDEHGVVTDRNDWLIDPEIAIPEAAARVHGITTEIAQQSGMQAKAGVQQIIAKLAELIDRGLSIVVYNAPFDFTLLKHEAMRHGLDFLTNPAPVIDPLVIDKHCDTYRKGKRTLDVVAAHYGVTLGRAHDAGEDAIAAGHIARELSTRYADKLPEDAMQLHEAQVKWAEEQSLSFQQYMRKAVNPEFVAETGWPVR